jgi:fucose permease
MNAHAIGVERRYRRSILQGFHGTWSVGAMVAGAVGAVAAGLGVPVGVHLGLAGIVLAAGVLLSARSMLPAAVADAHPEDADTVAPEPLRLAAAPRLLRVLVPLALLGILCVVLQNAAASWSAIYLTDVLAQAEGVAAVGYVLYMAAMVVGRMTNDRWVDRFGRTLVVRAGALVGAAGVLAVIASASVGGPPLAFAGFALVGIGSSPMFPVMMGVAGSRPGIAAGHGVALVAWMVRIGLMVAPASIGIAADAFGIGAAFVIPLLAALVIAVAAAPLTGATRNERAAQLPRAA